MTAVTFHFNVADTRQYACRLVRKALRSGAHLCITGPGAVLVELDRLLWTFEPLEFIPHWRGPSAAVLPRPLARTPVVLVEQLDDAALARPVLVNLGSEVPAGFDRFERLVELVGRDDAGRQAARARWRTYAGAGHGVEGHEVAA